VRRTGDGRSSPGAKNIKDTGAITLGFRVIPPFLSRPRRQPEADRLRHGHSLQDAHFLKKELKLDSSRSSTGDTSTASRCFATARSISNAVNHQQCRTPEADRHTNTHFLTASLRHQEWQDQLIDFK
jgi:hypothetical protein